MKTRILYFLVALVVAPIAVVSGQATSFALSVDSVSGKYAYTEVIEFPGKTQAEIHQKVRALVTVPTVITLDTDDEMALRYTATLGAFKYVKLTERFQFKEGKARWVIEDIEYLFNASSLSHFDPLEKLDERQLKKLVPQINELFGKGREDMMKKLATKSDDW